MGIQRDAGLNDPGVMRAVALGMADGQLHQADFLLCVADGRAKRGRGKWADPPLVAAILHMRSACGWLTRAAQT